MMSQSIVSLASIQAKARAAHAAGAGRDEHHMNWHAAALPHWQSEWDRCEAEKEHLALIKRPITHSFLPLEQAA